LENLAFSYCMEEVEQHGQFLKNILSEVNGFIILDLHNVYCQAKNFGVTWEDMLQTYPLGMVREIHISGGSWADSKVEKGRKIRRDTHDNAVPNEVFEYLEKVIPRVPNLKFVILEQLGTDLKTEQSRIQFRADFERMTKICKATESKKTPSNNNFLPAKEIKNKLVYESKKLATEQDILTNILEQSANFQELKTALSASILSNSEWKTEQWDDAMLETAFAISQKWKDGFE